MTPSNGRYSESTATPDQVFRALSHPVRRRILTSLGERNPLDVEELASMPLGPDDGRTLAVELHHRHVPHLDEAGFVEWDRETDTITRGPHFEAVQPVIETVRDRQDERPHD